MKNQVLLVLFLFFGFAFLVYLFPVIFVEGAKLESGVTINAPSSAGTCQDTNNDGVNDITGAQCTAPTGPAAGTCGLQIVSGVPINYGQVTAGRASSIQNVTIKNEGTYASIVIKGGNWVSDAAGNPTISGPEATRVSALPPTIGGMTGDVGGGVRTLRLAELELGQISSGQSKPIYFQLGTWVNAPSGSYHQDVTIDLRC